MGGYDMRDKNIPYEYEPISMWGYFGYEILFISLLLDLLCY